MSGGRTQANGKSLTGRLTATGDVPSAGQAASLQDWFSPVGTAAGPGASDQPGPPGRLG